MAISLSLSIYRQEVCYLNNKSYTAAVDIKIKNAKNKCSGTGACVKKKHR